MSSTLGRYEKIGSTRETSENSTPKMNSEAYDAAYGPLHGDPSDAKSHPPLAPPVPTEQTKAVPLLVAAILAALIFALDTFNGLDFAVAVVYVIVVLVVGTLA